MTQLSGRGDEAARFSECSKAQEEKISLEPHVIALKCTGIGGLNIPTAGRRSWAGPTCASDQICDHCQRYRACTSDALC